jgi:hypothetical protein
MKRHQYKVEGYDCRASCSHRVKGEHGICSEKWNYVLTRDDGDVAITLMVSSGIYPATVTDCGQEPHGSDLTLHIGWPTTRGELRRGDAAGSECTAVKRGRCFDAEMTFTTAIGADDFCKTHFVNGAGYEQPERFWKALEDKLVEWSKSVPPDIGKTYERCMHCDGTGTVRRG